MANPRLLQAIFAAGLLAAVPAMAQSETQPAGGGGPNTGRENATTPGGMAPSNSSLRPMHNRAMNSGMHASRSDSSQSDAVERLNDQSLQAARQGQAFNAMGGTSSSTTQSGGSGSMNDMSGGSMSNSSPSK